MTRRRHLITGLAVALMASVPPLTAGAGGDCTIEGTNKGEHIEGTTHRDVICAKGGGDMIEAKGGNDVIFAGRGIDTIYAGRGDDDAYGGDGRDYINGEQGADELFGNAGGDPCLRSKDGKGNDSISGGPQHDIMQRDKEPQRPAWRPRRSASSLRPRPDF